MERIFSEDPDPLEFVEYYLENSHFLRTIDVAKEGIFSSSGMILRDLTPGEVSTLVKQNNYCRDWEKVHVSEDFIAEPIINNQFLGEVTIGRLDGTNSINGKVVDSGIMNSTIYDAQIGNSATIQNVQMLSDVAVFDHGVICNCTTVSHGSDLTFGVGKELALA
ncbi:MAG: DUF4954 family protein, partial [Spirochaetales bacterium]|nr:DUF4954 family protein [Spirochaetales bacterium]